MGSSPTPRTLIEPTKLIQFGLWLRSKGNRESTIERKLRFLKYLSGSFDEMVSQVLSGKWVDQSKAMALTTIQQYAEYKGFQIKIPEFRVYDNREMYVPNPTMIKQLIYRIRKISLRSAIVLAVETGASASEVLGVTWKDVNLTNKTVIIRGVKGHRTTTYQISDELITLLAQILRNKNKIFSQKTPNGLNDSLRDYVERLSRETGNTDFLKIHFHSLRHFAISWEYFKTKNIVETQRFARHCNIQNTLKYVHIVKLWIKENEYDVVYAVDKVELTKYLSEGYILITKTEWGYCLTKPKNLT